MIREALRVGFSRAGRLWGLSAFLLVMNLLTAALLAVPLTGILEASLRRRGAATGMLYGFDYPWWSHWADTRPGWSTSFGPEIFGAGFAFKNLDLLLRGSLPSGLFLALPGRDAPVSLGVDPVILGLGTAYLLGQVFLAGGVIAALRGAQGGWTFRGLLHGSGFYCGRLLRLFLLVLAASYLLFLLNLPFARWADEQAAEAVSGRTATAWLLGRHGLLLIALLFVNLVSSYARVIMVLEERSSAFLALVSSVSFCLRHFVRTWGHLLAIVAAALLLLASWALLDGHWTTTGYKTQAVTLLIAEALVFGRIFLRVAFVGGQISLYRRLTGERT